ncbi:MAG TPA: hypothetical protein VNV62_30010 [Trebonia sp.]|nr:hypothetical protein [Trebonia sp.]
MTWFNVVVVASLPSRQVPIRQASPTGGGGLADGRGRRRAGACSVAAAFVARIEAR